MQIHNHGGDISAVQKLYPNAFKPWIDLSTGINPNSYPWLSKIPKDELSNASQHLPQHDEIEKCIHNWIKYLNADHPEEWLLTSGSQAFINLIPKIFPNHKCVIPIFTYNEHERIWNQLGRKPLLLSPSQILDHDFENNTILIITNPNNPDGYIWKHKDLKKLKERLAEKDGYLIIDEAFADLYADVSLVDKTLYDNLVVMRSFGKFFGLAGIRLGAIRASSKIKSMIEKEIGPWSVNALAIKIAQYALIDQNWIDQNRILLSQNTLKLRSLLKKNKFTIVGGTDLFTLTTHENAQIMNDKFNQNGIYVRTFTRDEKLIRFGLPRGDEEFQRLQDVLK